MADIYGNDTEKMLDWDKPLGEQSEYVQKAIEPLLTLNFAYTKECMEMGTFGGNFDYKNYLETKNKEDPNFIKELTSSFSVGDLYDYLQGYDDDNEKTAVEKLKILGIEGEHKSDINYHVYDDEYIKSLDHEAYFEEQQNKMLEEDEKNHQIEMEDYLDGLEKETEPIQTVSNPQLETAQKIGYVQGVCESVLAFNTDENRKIMSDAAMTFLSKKLLSEMNVTKDMAQKFANPETYKALEQCVFAPKQEQQLEQTVSHNRKI